MAPRSLLAAAAAALVAACGGAPASNPAPDAAGDPCLACVPAATCTATGAAPCDCPDGFAGDGTLAGSGCVDVDECAEGLDGCVDEAAGGACTNSDGTFACGCAAGFVGDGDPVGAGCVDVDECAEASDTCLDEADHGTCTNVAGGFTCGCADGFTGDGLVDGTGCVDVDECAAEVSPCAQARCTNTSGGFTCAVLLAASHVSDHGWVLSPTTGQAIGALQFGRVEATLDGVVALATDPTTGLHYVILHASTVRYLSILEPETGQLSTVAPLADRFSSLAFRGDGQLFALTGDGATTPEALFTMDKATGAATFVRALGAGVDGEVLAYNPDDGDFYHWSGNHWFFERIDGDAPHDVTPISDSAAFIEIFAATYLGDGEFLVTDRLNLGRRFHVDGTVEEPPEAGYADDLRGFAWVPVDPTRYAVTPSTGVVAGGDTVTIGHRATEGPSAVRFGGAAATIVSVDATSIVVTTPAAVGPGPVAVTIEHAGADGTFTYEDAFTYEP